MEDCIRVVCRLRPCNEREKKLEGKPCVFVNGSSSLVVETKPQPNLFTFDYIGDENSTQQQMFDNVGRGIMDTCRNGYNGTIVCILLLLIRQLFSSSPHTSIIFFCQLLISNQNLLH